MKISDTTKKLKNNRKDGKSRKVKCWKVFKCGEKECPAFESDDLKCWLFSGTYCRKEIQGKFIEKLEMCMNCEVFKKNMSVPEMRETCGVFAVQMKEYKELVEERDKQLEGLGLELAMGLSEAFEALKKIASGDPEIRILETSEIELIAKLKRLVNITAQNIGEIVDQSHEFAISLAEHFDVLHRVSQGDLNARVTGDSRVELLESLKHLTNRTIENISREIAERIQTEESLKKMEELESSVLSAIPHAVVGLRERKIIFANEAVEKVFGWNPWELVGKDTRVLFRNNEEYEKVAGHFYPVLKKQKTHSGDFLFRHKDGADILCHVSAARIGRELKEQRIVVVYEDITEKKRIEEALQESEKKYFDLYQNAPDGYHSMGPDGTFLDVNETWLRMLGYERDEVIGRMKLTDLFTEDGIKIFREVFPRLLKQGSFENVEQYFKRKDGTLLPVLVNATAVYDKKGNFLRSRTIVRDNSERKRYEKILIHAAEEWRVTFDSMPYGVMLLNKDSTIMRVNNYIARLYGMPFDELIGKRCSEVIYGSSVPVESCPFLKSVNSRTTESSDYYDPRLKKQFIVHAIPVPDSEGMINVSVLSLIDITDIKEKEKRLVESRDAFLNMLKETDVAYKELQELYNALIHSFVNAIDAKSPWTKGHSERVTQYAVTIAKDMDVKEKDIERLRIAALLHDIGKIGTYDILLDKPDKLTAEEFEIVKKHPAKGAEILEPVRHFHDLLPIIRHHHERIDGRGYPDGLKDDEIPLLSKILCIADSFDSMTSDRPYRPAPSRDYAISEIKRCSGTQFDPEVAGAFLRVLSKS